MTSLVNGVPGISCDELQSRQKIGETDSSKLYTAKWGDKNVVVKRLKSRRYDDVEDFYYETRLMTLFSRIPFIVEILATVEIKNKWSIVMENGGISLTKFLEDHKQSLDWPSKILIASHGAQGLGYIHLVGACHGDVKSPNILINEKRDIKICDFGFSFIEAEPDGQLIRAEKKEITKGSPRWAQPERCRVPPQKYNQACDVFSFGVVMGEIATCELPHKGLNTYDEIVEKLLNQQCEHPPKDTPLEYAEYTEKATALKPQERPSAFEIANGLGLSLARLNPMFPTT